LTLVGDCEANLAKISEVGNDAIAGLYGKWDGTGAGCDHLTGNEVQA